MKREEMSLDESVEDILLRYPAIRLDSREDTSANQAGVCLVGNVHVQGHWYHITVNCPHFPRMLGVQLGLQIGIHMVNFTYATAGAQPDWTLDELLEQLPKLMSQNSSTEELVTSLPINSTAINLYAAIAELNTDNYSMHVNENCSRIRFSKFEDFSEHYLELELPSLQLIDHSLADCEGITWPTMFSTCPSLKALVQQFMNYLEDLREFYAQFTDIDELCYVVQPSQPSTKHNWRLFLLSERVFLKLSISDPFAPASSMSLHIIGPSYEVEQLRRCYSDGLKSWDVDLDIHKNLLRIFDLCFFPMPPAVNESKQSCNICYCYQLDGQVPLISCDNPKCTLVYHATCLRQWFNTLSDGKTFLDVSLGTCPFCRTKLSTSFNELLEH